MTDLLADEWLPGGAAARAGGGVPSSSGWFWMIRVFTAPPEGLLRDSRRQACSADRATGEGGVRVSGVRSGAQIQQYGEHAARLATRRRDAELGEDAGDVLLRGPQRDDQVVRDALVGGAGRHQLQHLTFARGQYGEWVVAASSLQQGGHDLRIDGRAAGGNPPYGAGEVLDVADPVLQQVPDTL